VELMMKQEHLTKEGLAKIVNIKASMNFAKISEAMLSLFPIIEPVKRPIRTNCSIYHPY
jgi:hypothetical protein